MTNVISSPASKKARFLLLKQKDVASSPAYHIEFPKSYSELFEIARTKFKGKIVVRTLYDEENSVITSIESLKSGSIIYASSKSTNQNSPTMTTINKSPRGLSVQVSPSTDKLSKTIPNTTHTQNNKERAQNLTTTTPSPKIKSKTLAVTNAAKSEKKSTYRSKESPNISTKETKANRPRKKASTLNKPISSTIQELSPKKIPTSPAKTGTKNANQSSTNANQSPTKDNKVSSPQKETETNQTPTNQKNKVESNKSTPNTNTNSTASKTTPSSQIKTSPSRRPRASSLTRSKASQVESPTEQVTIPIKANEEPVPKKSSLSPPSVGINSPKQSNSPLFQQINFSDSNDDQNKDNQNSNKKDDNPVVQLQIQEDFDQQEMDQQSKLSKRRTTRSSTCFDQINKTGSQGTIQTTSKTYFRLKNNIIQDDSSSLKSKTIQQPKSSASVPHIHSQSSVIPNNEFAPKNHSSGFTATDNDSKPEKENGEDDDSKLFSQIHLRDRKGRRSNTLFSKKSIESAIDVLTYFSPRNVTLKPKQANIQSDGDDDDENIYKSSQFKNDKSKNDDKDKEKKETEKDTLDAFRDSEGSDLFSSSSSNGDLQMPIQNKAPLLSLNPVNTIKNNNNNSNANNNTDNKNSPINIVPVRYEAQPMSSPANLDQFMESDDDMFMFGSDSDDNQNKNLSPLKLNANNNNNDNNDKEYSDYDEYDEYDEYEIELNNFADTSPTKILSKPIQQPPQPQPKFNLMNNNKPQTIKVSPSPSGQIGEIDPKNPLNYAKNAISHHRSQSRSSYSFQDQSKLDITAIIDGSLQSPISVPVHEQEEEITFDILPRNRSNSVALDTSSTSSSRNKNSPRIPKRPDVIQFHTNGVNSSSNNNITTTSSTNSGNGINLKPRPRNSNVNSKTQTKQTKFHSLVLASEASSANRTNNLSSKSASISSNISGSSSTNRTRTNSLSHSQSTSRRSRNGSRSSTSSHYERIILTLTDSLLSGQSVQNDEDLVFGLIDRAVGRYPQESLGLPTDITPSKILPIMENQQASAWIAHGCLIASLQGLPDVDPSIFCFNDMVEYSRQILAKHIFYNESKLVNKVGSIMGSNLNFNVAIIGPRNSGKSTLLRVLCDQLIANLVLGETWRKTFVFIFNMQNFYFETRVNTNDKNNESPTEFEYEFDVKRFYITMVNMTIQHLLWHYPRLLGITKQLTRYFESVVAPNRKHMRHFPRTLSSYRPDIAEELQKIASILSTLWNSPNGFENFVNAVLLFPKMIAKSFNFAQTFFIIDHYDDGHRYVKPSSPFKDASQGFWLTDSIKNAFTENTNFIISSKDNKAFFESAFMQRKHVDVYSTTDIVKRPLSKINGSISDVIFSVMVEGSEEPLLLSFDACGGTPLYMFLWNKMNMAADDILDFKIENNNGGALNEAAKLFLENLFVDENDSKIKYKILSVKRMKKKQKK